MYPRTAKHIVKLPTTTADNQYEYSTDNALSAAVAAETDTTVALPAAISLDVSNAIAIARLGTNNTHQCIMAAVIEIHVGTISVTSGHHVVAALKRSCRLRVTHPSTLILLSQSSSSSSSSPCCSRTAAASPGPMLMYGSSCTGMTGGSSCIEDAMMDGLTSPIGSSGQDEPTFSNACDTGRRVTCEAGMDPGIDAGTDGTWVGAPFHSKASLAASRTIISVLVKIGSQRFLTLLRYSTASNARFTNNGKLPSDIGTAPLLFL